MPFIQTSFNSLQLIILLASICFILLAIYKYANKKFNCSVIFLLIGSFGINIFMALLDPYLNNWDERFHALVAKNMMQNPFEPMLFPMHPLDFDYRSWVDNKIWLHKQPLFLWQIALFFKMFGVNEFVLRLPNVIMNTALVVVIYRMGKILFNANTGFIASFLFTLSLFHLELSAGMQCMEHNTVAFVFYVTLSIWSWLEYSISGKRRWLIWIGIFSGFAILNKWLTGLLVYAGWFFWIIISSDKRNSIRFYFDYAISIAITFIVFVPWQMYISYRFPLESKYEYAYNTKHLFESIEGHKGDIWFYILNAPEQYGLFFALLLPISLVLFQINSDKRKITAALLFNLLFVYLFFSIIAQTKLIGYTFLVFSIVYVALGVLFSTIFFQVNKLIPRYSSVVIIVILVVLGYINFNHIEIERKHTAGINNYYGQKHYREHKIFNTELYRKLPEILPGKDYIIFGMKDVENVDLAFYTGMRGYGWIPNERDFLKLKSDNYKIAVFKNLYLPDYITSDTTVFVIPEKWK